MDKTKVRVPSRLLQCIPTGKGIPVPWFVSWADGKPDYQTMGLKRMAMAVRQHLCWLCGSEMGVYRAFIVKPINTVDRIATEPPCHVDCAEYAAQAGLPVRIEKPPALSQGISAIWITRTYELVIPEPETVKFRMGAPHKIFWYLDGRQATREEVDGAISAGLPALHAAVKDKPRAAIELRRAIEDSARWLPDRV